MEFAQDHDLAVALARTALLPFLFQRRTCLLERTLFETVLATWMVHCQLASFTFGLVSCHVEPNWRTCAWTPAQQLGIACIKFARPEKGGFCFALRLVESK